MLYTHATQDLLTDSIYTLENIAWQLYAILFHLYRVDESHGLELYRIYSVIYSFDH